MENFIITMDFDKDSQSLWVSDDCSSGCKYKVETKKQLKEAICNYIENYV